MVPSHKRLLLWGGLALLCLLRLVVAAQVPLVPDEAYYWLWSRHIQGGYLDHPFMVAFLIRLGTFLWGDTAFGVRFGGLVGFGLATLFLFLAAKQFFPQRGNAGLRAILLLNATLMAGIGLIPATPDVPLFVFLSLTMWALSHAIRDRGLGGPWSREVWGWWGLAGTGLGLALDSKYTAILWAVGLAGFVLFSQRKFWKAPGPWIGGGCAFLALIPTLVWNGRHGWAGFLKQGGRATQWHPGRSGQFLGELLAGQLAMLTPWVAVLCCVGLWRSRRENGVFLWLSVPAMLVFLWHVTGDRVQANWVWVLYPLLILTGAGYGGRLKGAVLTGGACTLLVYAQCLTGILPLPAHLNPIARLSAGWSDLAHELVLKAHEAGATALVTDDYALASALAFQKSEGVMIMGRDERWSYIQGLQHPAVKTVLYVEDAHYGPVPAGVMSSWRHDGAHPVRAYRLEVRHDLSGWRIW